MGRPWEEAVEGRTEAFADERGGRVRMGGKSTGLRQRISIRGQQVGDMRTDAAIKISRECVVPAVRSGMPGFWVSW